MWGLDDREGNEILSSLAHPSRCKISGWVTDEVCRHRQLLDSLWWDRLGPRQHTHGAYLAAVNQHLGKKTKLQKRAGIVFALPAARDTLCLRRQDRKCRIPSDICQRQRACCRLPFFCADSPQLHIAAMSYNWDLQNELVIFMHNTHMLSLFEFSVMLKMLMLNR